MTEIPGKPGQYEELCIDYETTLRHLRENGFDGYINSEFEGQRDQQDRGMEYLVDEVEQVRRHHEMLARLS
jgi:sugar phosphate isomerase/epimerase